MMIGLLIITLGPENRGGRDQLRLFTRRNKEMHDYDSFYFIKLYL